MPTGVEKETWCEKAWSRWNPLTEFHKEYFSAMLFADDPRQDYRFEPEPGEPAESHFEDISPELYESSVRDCDWFLAHPVVARILDSVLAVGYPEKAGRHLWYTRRGHGIGFWDHGEWPGRAGEILLERAESLKEVDIYLGDDGSIYGA